MEYVIIIVILAIWIGCGYLGRKICVDRGRSGGIGLFIGLVFGVFGLAVIWLFLGESTEHKIRREAEIRKQMGE